MARLQADHDKARKERMDKYFESHPDKQYFESTLEEDRKDTTKEEWLWWFGWFVQRINKTPAQRYQELKNLKHGWNHDSDVHTIEEECNNEKCRFWPEEGKQVHLKF